jgi:hypothetical protein
MAINPQDIQNPPRLGLFDDIGAAPPAPAMAAPTAPMDSAPTQRLGMFDDIGSAPPQANTGDTAVPNTTAISSPGITEAQTQRIGMFDDIGTGDSLSGSSIGWSQPKEGAVQIDPLDQIRDPSIPLDRIPGVTGDNLRMAQDFRDRHAELRGQAATGTVDPAYQAQMDSFGQMLRHKLTGAEAVANANALSGQNLPVDQRDGALAFGVDQAQSLYGGAMETAGRLFNSPSIEDKGRMIQADQQRDIQAGGYQSQYKGSILDQKTLADVGGWIKEKGLENLPSGGVSLGLGVAAAVAAAFDLPMATALGALTVLNGTAQGTGEVNQEFKEKGVAPTPHSPANGKDLTTAGAGVLLGMLDKVGAGKAVGLDEVLKMGPKAIAQRLAEQGYGDAAKEILKHTGKAIAVEGGTEMAQEAGTMGAAAAHGAQYSPTEVGNRLADAGVLGGGMGATVGVGTETGMRLAAGAMAERQNEQQAPGAQAPGSQPNAGPTPTPSPAPTGVGSAPIAPGDLVSNGERHGVVTNVTDNSATVTDIHSGETAQFPLGPELLASRVPNEQIHQMPGDIPARVGAIEDMVATLNPDLAAHVQQRKDARAQAQQKEQTEGQNLGQNQNTQTPVNPTGPRVEGGQNLGQNQTQNTASSGRNGDTGSRFDVESALADIGQSTGGDTVRVSMPDTNGGNASRAGVQGSGDGGAVQPNRAPSFSPRGEATFPYTVSQLEAANYQQLQQIARGVGIPYDPNETVMRLRSQLVPMAKTQGQAQSMSPANQNTLVSQKTGKSETQNPMSTGVQANRQDTAQGNNTQVHISAGSNPTQDTGRDYSRHTFAELKAEAMSRGIEPKSSDTRMRLEQALQEHDRRNAPLAENNLEARGGKVPSEIRSGDSRPGADQRETKSATGASSRSHGYMAAETEIAHKLDMDPGDFNLLPMDQKVKHVVDMLKDIFGFKNVSIDKNLPIRDGLDVLLDSYQRMSLMAGALNLPSSAISLNGRITFHVGASKGKALGLFYPATNLIQTKGRESSFSHEWGHGFDFAILDAIGGKRAAGASGLARRGSDLGTASPQMREAWGALMRAMFTKDADKAQDILEAEKAVEEATARVEAAPTKEAKAQAQSALNAAKTDLRRARQGAANPLGESSSYLASAQALDAFSGGHYWAMPTEMLARATEAYIANRVEGLANEMAADYEQAGNSARAEQIRGATDRAVQVLAQPSRNHFKDQFPQGKERLAVFLALEDVMRVARLEGVFGDGPIANPQESALGVLNPNTWAEDIGQMSADELRESLGPDVGAWREQAQHVGDMVAKLAGDIKNTDASYANIKSVAMKSLGLMTRSLSASLLHFRGKYPKSKAMRQLVDALAAPVGEARAVEATFDEAVKTKSNQFTTRLQNILNDTMRGKVTGANSELLYTLLTRMEGEALPTRTTANAHVFEAASRMRQLLDDFWRYLRDSGLDVGYARQGYLPRAYDSARIAENRETFIPAATEVYRLMLAPQLEEAEAKLEAAKNEKDGDIKNPGLEAERKRTQASRIKKLENEIENLKEQPPFLAARWFETASVGGAGDVGTIGLGTSPTDFMKGRKLPPEADRLLAPFKETDPGVLALNMFVHSPRKAEAHRRFGEGGQLLDTLYRQMLAEGVHHSDIAHVKGLVNIVLNNGRKDSDFSAVAKGVSLFTAFSSMVLMPRVVFASLAEGFVIPVQTGRFADTVKATVKQLASAKDRKELDNAAELLGILTHASTAGVMQNRYGSEISSGRLQDAMMANFFKITGLEMVDHHWRRVALDVSQGYFRQLTRDAISSGNSANKQESLSLLAELGVKPEQIAPITKWLDSLAGTFPTQAEMESAPVIPGASKLLAADVYVRVMGRMVRRAIQDPLATDKPALAHTTSGKLAFGLLAFSAAFGRNVTGRIPGRVAMSYDAGRKAGMNPAFAAFRASGTIGVIASAMVLLGGAQLIAGALRDAVNGREPWDDPNYQDPSWLAITALQRAGTFGLLDPAINTVTSARYGASAGKLLLGPHVGNLVDLADSYLKLYGRNTEKTSTAEHNAVTRSYKFFVGGLLNALLSATWAGRMAPGVAAWVVMQGADSGYSAKAVADAIAGPKPVKGEGVSTRPAGRGGR